MHRSKARKILADSPGLRTEPLDSLAESYGDARRRAARALRGEADPKVLPDGFPYTVDHPRPSLAAVSSGRAPGRGTATQLPRP